MSHFSAEQVNNIDWHHSICVIAKATTVEYHDDDNQLMSLANSSCENNWENWYQHDIACLMYI